MDTYQKPMIKTGPRSYYKNKKAQERLNKKSNEFYLILRQYCGLQTKQLAELFGITNQYLSMSQNTGYPISQPMRLRYAILFKIDVEILKEIEGYYINIDKAHTESKKIGPRLLVSYVNQVIDIRKNFLKLKQEIADKLA